MKKALFKLFIVSMVIGLLLILLPPAYSNATSIKSPRTPEKSAEFLDDLRMIKHLGRIGFYVVTASIIGMVVTRQRRVED